MSEIARTSSALSSLSLNQNTSAPSSPRASALDQFDANRTSSSARGTQQSKAANPSPAASCAQPATYGAVGQSPVAQAAATPVTCTVPAPVVYHSPQRSEIAGSTFTYQLGDIQLAPAAHQQTVQVPYYFGGNQHHIFPGNVLTAAQHSILVQPVITHENDSITIHNTHQAVDQRSALQVAQLECQLVEASPVVQSPVQSPIQSPAQVSPAIGKAGAFPTATAPVPVPSQAQVPNGAQVPDTVPSTNGTPVTVPSTNGTPVTTPTAGL